MSTQQTKLSFVHGISRRPEFPEVGGKPEIVPLELCYFDAVCRLENVCYPNPWANDLIRNEFSNPISLRRAMILGETLIGYSFNHLFEDELHVLNLAIEPAYRSRGLGHLLLSSVLHDGYHLGARQALLEVRASNTTAQRLYTSLGFRVVGLRRAYYQNNHEDALLLECTLS